VDKFYGESPVMASLFRQKAEAWVMIAVLMDFYWLVVRKEA